MKYIGIDISKTKHTCGAVDENGELIRKAREYGNTQEGLSALTEFLRGLGDDLRIGFEATGHYGVNLKLFLEHEGFEFMEFNPSDIHEYIKAHGSRRTQNDRLDPIYIAQYFQTLRPNEYRPVPKNFYRNDCLKRLTRYHASLVRHRSKELVFLTNNLDKTFPEFKPFFGKCHKNPKNRPKFTETSLYILERYGTAEKIANMRDYDALRKLSRGHFTASDFSKLKLLARNTIGESNEYLLIELVSTLKTYRFYDAQIDELEAKISELVTALDPPCLSIRGVGALSAAVIVAEIGDFSRFKNHDKLLSFAGLEPTESDSGQFVGKGKMNKAGSHYLRSTILNLVYPLIRFNPVFADYYHSKRSEGKSDGVAASHTAKKLLRVIFYLHKHNEKFDADKLR